jgi:DNA-directed RNA polymerase subunit M/transcription elongation factor TFIIS
MDIAFDCPECGQHLVIDEAGAGLVVQCPKCGRDVRVPPGKRGSELSPATKPVVNPSEDKERTVALKWTPPSGSAGGKQTG